MNKLYLIPFGLSFVYLHTQLEILQEFFFPYLQITVSEECSHLSLPTAYNYSDQQLHNAYLYNF